MTLDNTITLGNLISLGVLLVALIAIYWRMRELIFKLHSDNGQRLQALESRVTLIWDLFSAQLDRVADDRRRREEQRRRDDEYGG